MDTTTTFSSDKEPLQEILKTIAACKYQLPEFQRGWVWDDSHIVSLLASVSLSYPIGAVMMLENGNPDVRFKPRPFEGVQAEVELEPERFILDGQQRLTSLFQALYLKKPVKTRDIKKKEILRWYYIDMVQALDPNIDREEAVKSIPEEKRIKNFRKEILADYSTPQAEYASGLFPLSAVFDCADWRTAYNAHWNYDAERIKLFDQFERQVIKRFEQYQIPVIKLLKQTPKIAVCQVFEKVNTGGVPLTVFELVTASFAAEGYNLREDWEGQRDVRGHRISTGRKGKLHEQKVLQAVGPDELLQVISLLTTYHRKQSNPDSPVSCKRVDLLKLTLSEYRSRVEQATAGFLKAGRLLFQQKIFASRDLPYTTQLVPLATILAILADRAENDSVRSKLNRWYWCGVFGELYGGAIETRFARDVVEVLAWLDSDSDPSTVVESNFASNRLDTLRTRNSAAYKGLYALLMRDGGIDFRTGEPIELQTYFADPVDIHHIFPRSWCIKQGIEATSYDSIINKTPLSASTNRVIGGNAPSVYLRRLRDNCGIDETRQDEILATHVIDATAIKSDAFTRFFGLRREALLNRIQIATGKAIPRESLESPIDDEESEDETEEQTG